MPSESKTLLKFWKIKTELAASDQAGRKEAPVCRKESLFPRDDVQSETMANGGSLDLSCLFLGRELRRSGANLAYQCI